MANLFFGKFKCENEEYLDVEELAGITLEAGTSYLMQIQGVAFIIVKETQPTKEDGGFCLYNSQMFQYTPDGVNKLWVRNFGAVAAINIAS